MKAKNREQYVNAWQSHINQLINPMIDSDTPMEEWNRIRDELGAIVDKAADKVFPEIDHDELEDVYGPAMRAGAEQ